MTAVLSAAASAPVPLTVRPAAAVRMAPLPSVSTPLPTVTAPPTLPAPFQAPPLTARVPVILPPEPKLIAPLLMVALPVTVPVPANSPPLTARPPLAVRFAPLPRVKMPPATVVAPVTDKALPAAIESVPLVVSVWLMRRRRRRCCRR